MATGTLKAIWKNRRHFNLQIFGVIVFAVIVIFVVNLVSISVKYNKKVDEYLATITQYTTSFKMSLSGVSGTVNNVFVNSTGTQAFILMKFSNTSNLALDAGNYQVFVTNANNDGSRSGTPNELLSGEIYMFGSSGLVGLYFQSDIPFENQLKHVILRSYSKFTSSTSPYVYYSVDDKQYDQGHIFFNPGGTSASTIDFLENHVAGTDFDPTEIQRQVNTVTDEYAVRNEILEVYDDITVCIKKINEYQTRLKSNYGVVVPDLPQYILGDSFDTIEIYDDAGNVIDSYRKFIPATIMPGGTEYDWYVGSILSGYFRLVPNAQNITIPDYLSALSSDKTSRSYTYKKEEEWYYTDGTTVLSEFTSTSTAYEKEVWSAIEDYEELLKEYISLKTDYQTDLLPELLRLEHSSAGVNLAYTVRNDENAVLIY